jgi:hypothetical protein
VNRRQYLQHIAIGGVPLVAGCGSIGEDPGPFNFAIVNRRERSYHVEFTLWDDADEIIVDGAVTIAAKPPGDDYTVLQFDDLTRVTNGDTIDVRIRTAGTTFEATYEVTCNQSATAENNFFVRFRHLNAPTETEEGIEFSGSEC